MARGNKQRRNASRSTQPRSHNHLDQSMQSTPQDDWEHEQNTESIGSAQQHSSKSGVSFDDEGRDYGSSSRLPLVPPDHPESSSQQHTKSSSSSRRQSKSKPSRVQRKGAGRTSTTPQLATTSQSSQELSGGPKAVARNRFDDVIYTVEFAFAEPGVRLIGGIWSTTKN